MSQRNRTPFNRGDRVRATQEAVDNGVVPAHHADRLGTILYPPRPRVPDYSLAVRWDGNKSEQRLWHGFVTVVKDGPADRGCLEAAMRIRDSVNARLKLRAKRP
jgi:hypothetical protein